MRRWTSYERSYAEENKHPVIIPKDSGISDLIAKHFHHIAGHSAWFGICTLFDKRAFLVDWSKSYSEEDAQQLCELQKKASVRSRAENGCLTLSSSDTRQAPVHLCRRGLLWPIHS